MVKSLEVILVKLFETYQGRSIALLPMGLRSMQCL